MTRRYALYWLPAPGSRLDAFGKAVLGYDNVSGDTAAHPAAMEDLAASGVGFVVSSHDPRVTAIADGFVRLDHGRVVAG